MYYLRTKRYILNRFSVFILVIKKTLFDMTYHNYPDFITDDNTLKQALYSSSKLILCIPLKHFIKEFTI